ncbi:hypothetical protein, partial [Megasphaera sp.]|uniref:hypothetical protein n=1 Tax=Megasphaera sp. TaxID=2023260 RepID=UPI0030803FC5
QKRAVALSKKSIMRQPLFFEFEVESLIKEIRASHDGRTPPVTAPANHEPRATKKLSQKRQLF